MSKSKDDTDKLSSASANAFSSIENTVGVFQNRLRRQLSSQQERAEEAERSKQLRGQLLLQAMSGVRKALQETSKINLGDRFEFVLDVEDRDGWPRITLELFDSEYPEEKDVAFMATAKVLDVQHYIVFHTRSERSYGRVDIEDEEDLDLVPKLLKKAVRKFLDITAELVLNPKQKEQVFAPPELLEADEEIKKRAQDAQLLSEDVFSDQDEVVKDNRVEESETDEPLSLEEVVS